MGGNSSTTAEFGTIKTTFTNALLCVLTNTSACSKTRSCCFGLRPFSEPLATVTYA